MPQLLRISLAALMGTFAVAIGSADEEAAKPEIPTEESIDEKAKQIRTRTTLYDAASIQELYSTLEKKKAEEAKRAPDHLNLEDMELLVLKDRVVSGYKLRNERELMQKMDPKPQNAINRLRELDPELANELLVAQRADAAFMAGENDAGRNADAGRTANMSAKQIMAAFEKAQEATRKALGGKRKAVPETP